MDKIFRPAVNFINRLRYPQKLMLLGANVEEKAALVEQATRASESLGQQTKHMDDLVDVFKISILSKEILPQQETLKKNYLKKEKRKIKTALPKSDEWTEF